MGYLESMAKFIIIIITAFLIGCAHIKHNSDFVIDITGDGYNERNAIKNKTHSIFEDFIPILKDRKMEFLDNEEKKIFVLENKLRDTLSEMGYTFFKWSYVRYQNDDKLYYTLAVYTEKNDNNETLKKNGLRFIDIPKSAYEDPENLIKKWQEYSKLALNIHLEENESSTTLDNIDVCGSVHCLVRINNNETFDRYEDFFKKRVLKNKTKLIEILLNDMDYQKRESAAYLLSYIYPDGDLISLLNMSIRDINASVRNASLRVMNAVIRKDKSIEIPMDTLLALIYSHENTDLNKTLYILVSNINDKEIMKLIKINHLERIEELANSNQPNILDPAKTIYQAIVSM